jgi:hypothetical protein
MKIFTNIIMVMGLLVALMSFSGCSSKQDMVTPHYGSVGMVHATNFGGVKKVCVDDVMYLSSHNGMTPAIDRKTGRFIECRVDEYQRVIPVGTFGK